MTHSSLAAGEGRKNSVAANNLGVSTPIATRRIGHGGTLRSKPVAADQLRQPQDGAAPTRAKLATITAHLQNDLFQEPEDARLTGGTRSMGRRLLGLNFGTKLRKVPAMVAGTIPQPKVA